MSGVDIFLFWANIIIFIYFITVQLFCLLLLILAIPELVRRIREIRYENFDRILKSESVPQISIIVPAFNEADCIVFTARNLLSLVYRYKEVIIVNDGSNDQTLEILKKTFHLYEVAPDMPSRLKTKKIMHYFRSENYPDLLVLDKMRGGKIDANNAGISAASSPYVLAVDADTIISDMALQALMRPFLMRSHVVAAGGSIGIANGCEFLGNKIAAIRFPKTLLPGIQVVEYLRAFLFGRLGWLHLGGNLIISGAFGLFDRQLLLELHGYQIEIGDDVDLVVRLHHYLRKKKKAYFVSFIPDLVGLTEVPGRIKPLIRQRLRWHQGLLNALQRNIGMLLNPFYGKVGLIGMPYFVFIEGCSPLVELLGYMVVVTSLAARLFDWYFALWYLLLALGFPIFLSAVCIFMEGVSFKWYFSSRAIFKMLLCALLEQIGYRQILLFSRLKAIVYWILRKNKWVKEERSLFTANKTEQP